MKNKSFVKLLGLLLIIIHLAACSTDVKLQQVKEIKTLEAQLYKAKILDKDKGLQIIDKYLDYAKTYPKDTLSANYLFKAGEIAMNLNMGSQAIFYFDKLASNFPDFRKAPECLFLKAFILENQMNNIGQAEKFYKEFLKKYPNHALANDAQASIEYLGKSPEELVKMFQEKNKAD